MQAEQRGVRTRIIAAHFPNDPPVNNDFGASYGASGITLDLAFSGTDSGFAAIRSR